MKSLDKRIHENNDLCELEADLFSSYKYDESVVEICPQVHFGGPSAILSEVVDESAGAGNHYSVRIRPGKTTAPSGDRRTGYADKVVNVSAFCELCVGGEDIVTAADESDRPKQLTERATDCFEGRL